MTTLDHWLVRCFISRLVDTRSDQIIFTFIHVKNYFQHSKHINYNIIFSWTVCKQGAIATTLIIPSDMRQSGKTRSVVHIHWEKNQSRLHSHFQSLACPNMNTHLSVKLTHFHTFWVTHWPTMKYMCISLISGQGQATDSKSE